MSTKKKPVNNIRYFSFTAVPLKYPNGYGPDDLAIDIPRELLPGLIESFARALGTTTQGGFVRLYAGTMDVPDSLIPARRKK